MSLEHKKMSVLIHQDGLSFFIYSQDGLLNQWNKPFKHESNPIEILQSIELVYEQEPLLNTALTQVTLIYHHSVFTGVPASIYDENYESDYLKYNTRLLETDVISADHAIDSLDYKTVYIAYSNINNYFFDKYGDFNFYHYATLALAAHYEQLEKNETVVILDVKASDFYLTIFDNGILKLHNIYPQQAIEDILYYTLFTAQHNGLDPETLDLKIITSEKNEQLFDLLYTYIRHVSYLEDSHTYLQKILCA